jgi:hypothetical protein
MAVAVPVVRLVKEADAVPVEAPVAMAVGPVG